MLKLAQSVFSITLLCTTSGDCAYAEAGAEGEVLLTARIKSSFLDALICAASRRIPAGASTNQGTQKGDLI
jgi:hypothetical protein